MGLEILMKWILVAAGAYLAVAAVVAVVIWITTHEAKNALLTGLAWPLGLIFIIGMMGR